MRLASPTLLASIVFGSLSTLAALAGSAAAQSGPPGQCACTPPPQAWETPAATPPAPEPWEAHRFGLGVRVGGMTISEPATDGSEDQNFSVGGLAARYRASRRIELELAIEGGEEKLDHGYQSDYQMSAVTASMLVHLAPQSVWDWYVLGGIGGNDRRYKDDAEEYADQRSHLAIGLGVERRWEHLVLGVEVRGLALSPRENEDIAVPQPEPYPQPVPTATTVRVDEDEPNVGGAQLSLSATWFF